MFPLKKKIKKNNNINWLQLLDLGLLAALPGELFTSVIFEVQ